MEGEGTIVSGVSGRYATALFDLAREQDALDEVKEQLERVRAMLEESADLQRLVKSPAFSADDQARAVGALLEHAEIGGITRNFLLLLVKNRRLFAIGNVIRDFATLFAHHHGEVVADVVTAHALDEPQSKALKKVLGKIAGKEIQMNITVDPAILGGVIVKLGSRMIDDSLRSKLNRLKFAMKEVG